MEIFIQHGILQDTLTGGESFAGLTLDGMLDEFSVLDRVGSWLLDLSCAGGVLNLRANTCHFTDHSSVNAKRMMQSTNSSTRPKYIPSTHDNVGEGNPQILNLLQSLQLMPKSKTICQISWLFPGARSP
jgi:hypothetical protein